MKNRNLEQKEVINGVKDFLHRKALEKNSPFIGLTEVYNIPKGQTVYCPYKLHLDLHIVWPKEKEHTSFEIYVVSLKVQKPTYTVVVFVTRGYQKLIEPFFFGESPLSFYDKAYFVYFYLSGKLLPLSKVSSYHNIHTLRLSTGGFNARACHQIR
ncbi:MAG: hypothetical protein RMJ39_05495 [Deltaproteobacteria bacterium]|nr:hypothetical protein [Deltaproteobacteria bacterium]